MLSAAGTGQSLLSVAAEEQPIHSRPREIAEEAAQSRFHPLKIHIMPQAALQRQARGPRLIGIDLPRVEVEDAGFLVAHIDAAERPARQRVGQEAEIAAAAARDITAEELDRRQRDLGEAALGLRLESEAR